MWALLMLRTNTCLPYEMLKPIPVFAQLVASCNATDSPLRVGTAAKAAAMPLQAGGPRANVQLFPWTDDSADVHGDSMFGIHRPHLPAAGTATQFSGGALREARQPRAASEAAGSPTRITLELPEPLMTSVSTINVIATPSSPFSQLPRSPPSNPSEGGTSDAGNVDSPGVSDEGQCEPPRGSQRRHLESSATALQPHPPRMSKAPPSNVQLQDNRRVGPAIKTPTALLVCVDSIAGGEPERFSRPFAGRRARLRRQRRAHRVRAALAKAAAPVFDAETEQGDSVGEGDSVVGGRGYTEYARLFASLGYVVRWRSLV